MVKGAVGKRALNLPLPRRVLEWPEERAVNVLAVPGGFEIIVDALEG